MIVIGLTGGMASGKSACARYLKSRGVAVLDADEISRELTRGNNLGARRIKEELGERFFSGGELDRAETARWAFASPQNTEKLNSIIHPLVISRLEEEIKRLEREGQRAVVLDCPLLFESGLDKICAQIWLVTASYEIRLERARLRSGLTREEALARISRQLSDQSRAARSNLIIENNGSIKELEAKLKPLADELLGVEDEFGEKEKK